ncbi:MAG: IPT/TIG domain-containing protein [Gemmatimonadaceae bacterium]
MLGLQIEVWDVRLSFPVCYLLAGALVACGDDSGNTPSEVFQLTQQGGDGQSAPAGALLSQPLQVGVKDATGTPVSGVEVLFAVESGSGAQVSDTVVTTGLAGIASVNARLGPAQGTYRFKAFLENKPNDEVGFTATATPPPTLVSASKTAVQAGDTIILTGTNFNTTTGGNVVLFGTVKGRVLQGPTPTRLEVVVPPCITPGAVAVTVLVGSAPTNPLSVTYAAPAGGVRLELFEALTIAGTELGTCLGLEGDSANYVVVPQFATATAPLAQVPFTLGSQGTLAQFISSQPVQPTMVGGFNRVQADFELSLRRTEHQLAPAAAALGPTRFLGGQVLEALTLNSTRSFKVLSDLDGNNFKSATGRLKFIGANILLYVDTNAPPGFSDAQLAAFGRLFDTDLYPIGVNNFGTASDIDRNGKVIVLLTPVVNALTDAATCSTDGFVTGFFFGFDLASTSVNSNKGEIFYALVPDANASVSCAHSVSQVEGIVPSTFIHELQHMISFNQKVLVRGGSDESVWLNEALSHIAEELASRYYENKFPPPSGRTNPAQVFPDSASPFITGNLFNSYRYLTNPDLNSLTLFSSTGTLDERGAAWLFLRWLGDQTDSTIYGRLVQTSRTSTENVEAETGETFQSLFGDFSISLWTDSIPGFPRASVQPRYRFASRNLRFLYDALYRALIRGGVPSSTVPRPFPIVLKPLPFNGSVTASMVPGTMDFYRLQTLKPSSSIGLQFSAPGAGQFPANLKAQVGVVRLPPTP